MAHQVAPNPSHLSAANLADYIERARTLVPQLKERAAATEDQISLASPNQNLIKMSQILNYK